jgi:hypothetical protein
MFTLQTFSENAFAGIGLTVNVTGVVGTGEIQGVLVWDNIVPAQDPSYSPITPSQSPSYGAIAPEQDPGWKDIAA